MHTARIMGLFYFHNSSYHLGHMTSLPNSWFAGNTVDTAKRLLGKIVRRGSCAGIIVETEAYTTDPASHAFHITPRSAVMRDTYGYWYIYFTYGIHWCANITTDANGTGAVLIRAVEPVKGIPLMQRRRGTNVIQNLCSGPAKFCEAFGITGKENGLPLDNGFSIYDAPPISLEAIGTSGRIGIRNGTELPWRFYIKENPFISRKW